MKQIVSHKYCYFAKKILLMFCVLFGSVSCADIQGQWEIDTDKTLEFNDAHSKMTALEKQLLKCLSENSSLMICEGHFFFFTKEHSCIFGGKEAKIDGFKTDHKYEKIFDNNDVVVMLNKDAEFIEVIHLVADNQLWVYYSGEHPEYNSHVRHYYKRVARCK